MKKSLSMVVSVLIILSGSACAAPNTAHPGWTSYDENGFIWDMEFDENGDLWIFGTGVSHWKRNGNKFAPDTDIPVVKGVLSMDIAQDGTLWVWQPAVPASHATPGVRYDAAGFSQFDGESWNIKRIENIHLTESAEIYDFAVSSDGQIWAIVVDGMTREKFYGLLRFNGSDWIMYTRANGLPEDTMEGSGVKIDVAPDGTIWISGNGLLHFDGHDWTSYDVGSKYSANVCEPNNCVHNIKVAPDGAVWAEVSGDDERNTMLFIYDDKEWKKYSLRGDTSGDARSIFDIKLTYNDFVWCGGLGNEDNQIFACFDGSQWTTYNNEEVKEITGQYASSVIMSKDGRTVCFRHMVSPSLSY